MRNATINDALADAISQERLKKYLAAQADDLNAALTLYEHWLIDPIAAPLFKGDPISNGKLIAELKFGFWVGLLAAQYDATLWRRALYRCFRSGPVRSKVHGRLNAIRRFRNRVTHHEPIFHRPVATLHDEIIEAIGWLCRDTRAWAEHHSRLPSVLSSN